ncbi:MAG: ThuA domain-containing protein [bacterium]
MIRLLFSLMLTGVTALGADTASTVNEPQPAEEIARLLRADDPRQARSAVAAVAADERLVPVALAALPSLKDEAKAQVLFALIPHAEASGVKPALLAALKDESQAVRLAGIRAAVRTADDAALPALFAMTSKPDEEGRAATLAMAAMAAEKTGAFLYGEMKKEGPERVRAIGLLAARGQPDLVPRLCDKSLYAVAGVNAAAGSAFRTCVRQDTFAPALAFTFGPLPASQRAPLVSALASVIRQLPDEAGALREVAGLMAKADAAGKIELVALLGGVQTEASRDLLAAQAKAEDVELRKAAVRVLAQWNSALAVAPLMDVAREDKDRAVRILAVRGVLTLLQKPKAIGKDQQLAVMTELAGVAERAEDKKALLALVMAVGGPAAEALQRQLDAVDAGSGSKIRVLLIAGANNHNWQETTPALKAIFAEATKFVVTVTEAPWELKPADLAKYDVLVNNWNTFGSDKREWNAEMKAAFIAWIKNGGGFFVLHAGGCLFYDWEEFQSLTGGAWETDTFHPHIQPFTVNIADKGHPVTRGLKDFETVDEPWQKIANRNPARQVLAAGVVSKENKGSGEPEPFVFVTELGKGRCFNLVLGHDAKALNNAGCKTLILRGAEWAATGNVK